MTEEQVNTQEAEGNSETNPNTQVEKKDVPYGRFQEVNNQKNEFKSETESLRNELAELKAAQEEARQEALKKNSEFETLYNETNSENSTLKEQLEGYKKRELEESERLDAKIPEEHKVFTKHMSNTIKARYIDQHNSGANAGKTDSSRAGTTAKGEFGGYNSMAEWAAYDPKGAEEHLAKNVKGFSWGNLNNK